MNIFLVPLVLLAVALPASAARIEGAASGSDRIVSPGGLTAELALSPDGLRAVAHLTRCREYVFDWPQQCDERVSFELPGLAVDAKTRTITSDGAVVARWSRFGRFVRMDPAFRLRHEVVAEKTPSGEGEIRRAKLYLEPVASR